MPRRKKHGISPENVLKETVYFGSGEDAKRIAEMLNADMKRLDMDLSPLIVRAYTTWHGINPEIEAAAEGAGMSPADLINQAFQHYRSAENQVA